MRTDTAQPIRLSDYRPPSHLIPRVALDVHLNATATEVAAHLSLAPNPAADPSRDLVLAMDGTDPRRILLDGVAIGPDRAMRDASTLTIRGVPDRPFTLDLLSIIDPEANTALSGLYRSSGVWCTQCEAEGFRRITPFLDRPDVLSTYAVRIEAVKAQAPVLLSNGNRVGGGDLPGGRHFAVWEDPWPKPSYLFALVAGDLAVVRDRFVTMEGREVRLEIYVEHGKEDRCAWAMESLKRCMRWDETAFGRAYDLDVFMIVAVSDFNMGAMENKGLNIFNDKYVLALPEAATDSDYVAIESIVAHEYFHNWTGNRITCRDWFQLCLKEGLTVFRDQEFTSDIRSRAVKRITDVRNLRAQQFAEDQGPLAHPVRPDAYREINNFYTATVYEKGAELVRVLKTLIGADAFRRGMELYFARCDGTAATIEDFIACFAEASGRDLGGMMPWYGQAGTPVVTVRTTWDGPSGRLSLDISQSIAPTPGQASKSPVPIPLAIGLVDSHGDDLAPRSVTGPVVDGIILVDRPTVSVVFDGLPERPVPSIGRGFSAPVRLETDLGDSDQLHLFARDSDTFVKWQAGQTLLQRRIIADVTGRGSAPAAQALAAALAAVLDDGRLDPAFKAQILAIPSENDIAREIGSDIDPDRILAAREALRVAIARALVDQLRGIEEGMRPTGAYAPSPEQVGRRALANAALDLLTAAGDITRAAECMRRASNMTDAFAALSALCRRTGDLPEREAALEAFRSRHAGDALVFDKWLSLQAAIPDRSTLERVRRLMSDRDFTLANPNRARALIGAFAMSNPTEFARPDGAGFDLVATVAAEIDAKNPQLAARLLNAFRSWRVYESGRREKARSALERLSARSDLSVDSLDIVRRALD